MKNIVPELSLGTLNLRNKFNWLLATCISINDHKGVKLLPKLSLQKLQVFYHFLSSLQVYAKGHEASILLDILEKLRFGKSLVIYIINIFLDFFQKFFEKSILKTSWHKTFNINSLFPIPCSHNPISSDPLNVLNSIAVIKNLVKDKIKSNSYM